MENLEVIKKSIDDQIQPLVNALKETKENLEKKYDGLDKDTFQKQATALADLVEKQNKLEAEYKSKVSNLESIIARGGVTTKASDEDLDRVDKEKFDIALKSLVSGEKLELKAYRQASDPEGGYFVRPLLLNTVIKRIYDQSPVRPYASVLQSNTGLEMYTRLGRGSSSWVSEQGTRSQSNQVDIALLRYEPNEMASYSILTQKLLDNASINFEQIIAQDAVECFSLDENEAFLYGSGVGKPKGLLSTAYTFTDSASYTGHTNGVIETIKSGTNGAFTVEGLLRILGKLRADYATGANLYIARESFFKLLELKSTDNYHLIDPITMFFGSTDMQTQGPRVPVVFWDNLPKPAAFTTGTQAAIYGNINTSYQIVDGTSFTIQKDPYTQHPNLKYNFYKRTDGGVKNFDAYKVLVLSA